MEKALQHRLSPRCLRPRFDRPSLNCKLTMSVPQRNAAEPSALEMVLHTARASLKDFNNKRFKGVVRGVMLEHKIANHVAVPVSSTSIAAGQPAPES